MGLYINVNTRQCLAYFIYTFIKVTLHSYSNKCSLRFGTFTYLALVKKWLT